MKNERLDYGKYRRLWIKPRERTFGDIMWDVMIWTTRAILFPVFFMMRLIEWVYHLD